MAASAEETGASPVAGEVPRRRSLRRTLVFMFAPAVLVVLLLEGGLRVAGLPTGLVSSLGHTWADADHHALGPFRPSFRATIAFPPQLAFHPTFNAIGIRGPEIALERTHGLPRIVCCGDSTTFGYYVEDDATYPARLAVALQAAGHKAEVANGGCGTWTITDEALFFADCGSKLSPDVVVLLFCANDLDDLDRDKCVYEKQKLEIAEGDWLPRRILHGSALYEAHLRLRLALKKQDGPTDFAPSTGVTGDAAHWARYEQAFRGFAAQVAGANAKLLVAALPPYTYLGLAPTDIEERLPAIVARAGDPAQVGYVDLFGPFRSSSDHQTLYHLPLDAHPNARGNDLMASVIARALLERGWVATSR